MHLFDCDSQQFTNDEIINAIENEIDIHKSGEMALLRYTLHN